MAQLVLESGAGRDLLTTYFPLAVPLVPINYRPVETV
jgi:hypothetical protein